MHAHEFLPSPPWAARAEVSPFAGRGPDKGMLGTPSARQPKDDLLDFMHYDLIRCSSAAWPLCGQVKTVIMMEKD